MPKIKCSYCKKEMKYTDLKDIPTFPFCSKKCKLIDLGHWFNEDYKMEVPARLETESFHTD